MRRPTIKNENLRKLINEFNDLKEETPDETMDRLVEEIKHSCLIIAGDVSGNKINVPTFITDNGNFAMLFTDMGEFRKVFPDFDVGCSEHPFEVYKQLVEKSDMLGFIVNIKGECFCIPRELIENMGDMPELTYSADDAYTSEELKSLKDSIDNSALEEFIKDPKNRYDYDELVNELSASTLLTLMVSPEDHHDKAENGVISMLETGPLGYLYTERVGGVYGTVYTSEQKMDAIETPKNKYSQLVNISQMANFVLNDDMDGIIINPKSDNIVLTRDILLEFSPILEMICNDSRLNSAIFHMFLIEENA